MGIHVCLNKGPALFARGDNNKIVKNTLTNFKNLILKNHLANFNQTWHKAFLGEGDSSLFKWRNPPFSKVRNKEIANILLQTLKMFFLRITWPISTKLGTKHPWVMGNHVSSNEGTCSFPRGDNYEIVKIYWQTLKIIFSRIKLSKM